MDGYKQRKTEVVSHPVGGGGVLWELLGRDVPLGPWNLSLDKIFNQLVSFAKNDTLF